MAKIVKRYPLQNAGHLNEDRRSGLPDALLHHVLSFLDIEDVVQTCILSKRWIDVWSSFPFLNLSSKNREHVDFVKFSESLLFHRDGGSTVDTLRVCCSIDVASNVNSWIIFVSKRNVQVLDIQFDRSLVHNGPDESLTFTLTHRLYTCVFLRVLKLKLPDYYYKLNLPNRVYLPCLRILYFEKIIFDDDCCSEIISSCPRLQSLTLDACQFSSMVQLSISSPQLRTFILRDVVSSILLLDISAPRLTSLNISHSLSKGNVSIRSTSDFPYLRSASIYAEFPALASCNKLLTAVRNTQSLYLSEDFLWEFAHALENEPHADKWIQCRFDNLKHINLRTRFDDCEVIVIHQLLKVSPNIETLVLSNYSENFEDGLTADITTLSECKFYRLKQVKLEYFLGFENEMNLVKFFINNAENLKKLTLEPFYDCASDICMEGLVEMTEILLACPREDLNIFLRHVFQEFGLVLENKPHADNWIPCPLVNLKLVKHELLAISQLLKVSPNLEAFKLCDYAEDIWHIPCPADIIVWSELKLNRLKQVHLDEFYGKENEMNLLKFFIRDAENLEKLRLERVRSSKYTEELAELTKILLSCPRHVRLTLDSNSGEGAASLSVTFV